MGALRVQPPVLLVVAVFSGQPELLAWARDRLTARFGPLALTGPIYAFNQTAYYEASMGPGLHKQLLAFAELIPPEDLPAAKQAANDLEAEAAALQAWPTARPLNLDPGILSLGKFQLATTKDQAHRIYLRDGIFAEVTLHFQDKEYVPWPWTYADYRLPEVLAFLKEARAFYKQQLRSQCVARQAPR